MINYAQELNDEQYAVVANGDGHCLVLAGAGSGKTRVITYRVAYLLERGVPQENILLLTFTNKAAKEMMERATKLLQYPLDGIWGGTFHSLAVRILRMYGTQLGYQSNFTILDADDAEGLISLAMRDEGVDLKSKVYPKASLLNFIISFARNSRIEIEEAIRIKFSNFERISDTLSRVAARYEQKKLESNVMDFDDLLVNWLRILEEHEDIAFTLSNQFHYILVDEFQDTNTIQATIIKHMGVVHKNVLAVGDDAQSIYSFRAANIRNILDFEKDFEKARVFKLQMNYRSVPEILQLANSVISKNKEQHKKELKAAREPYLKPQVVTLASTFEEASLIGEEIQRLHNMGVAYGSMAVLFRAAHHSQQVEVELMRRAIPYDYRGGLRFFDRSHIKDVLAYLRVVHNVHDVVAWQRLLMMQEGIGDKTANKILHALKDVQSSAEVALFDLGEDMPDRARVGWENVRTIMQEMVNASSNVSQTIDALLRAGYREYLKERYDNPQDRVADIEQFRAYATRASNLEQFLTETSLSEEYSKKSATQGDRVILSTIHQSKGLEWDSVFVIRLTQGGFPSDKTIGEEGGIEEERRLFYVAVTRAQKHLMMTYPMMGGFDGTQYMEPSVFLTDIDPLLIASGVTDSGGDVVSLEGEDDEVQYVSEDEEYEKQKSKKRTGFLSSVEEL